jgi:hypothetical protein
MPLATSTGGGKSALPGGIGFVPVAKGKASASRLGGGVRGIASADKAPESFKRMPELLCSSPNALQLQSKVGFGERKVSKARARAKNDRSTILQHIGIEQLANCNCLNHSPHASAKLRGRNYKRQKLFVQICRIQQQRWRKASLKLPGRWLSTGQTLGEFALGW